MRSGIPRLFKPPIGTPIDWGNSLSQGLYALYPLWEGGGKAASDVVNGLVATILSNAAWSPGSYSVGLNCPSNAQCAVATIPTYLQFGWPLTIAVGFRVILTESPPVIFAIRYNSADTTPFGIIEIYESSAGVLNYAGNQSGSFFSGATGGSIPAGKDYVASLSISSTSQKLYLNGAQIVTGSTSLTNPNYSATSRFTIGASNNTCGCLYYWAAAWNRFLGPTEHAAIGSSVNGIWPVFAPTWRADLLTYLVGRGAGQIGRPVADRTGSDRRIWAD